MDIKVIKPKQNNKSDKYSWQLYKYFEKNKLSLDNIRVIYCKESTFDDRKIEFNKDKISTSQIWIGNFSEGIWFNGNTIGTIIGIGKEKYTI